MKKNQAPKTKKINATNNVASKNPANAAYQFNELREIVGRKITKSNVNLLNAVNTLPASEFAKLVQEYEDKAAQRAKARENETEAQKAARELSEKKREFTKEVRDQLLSNLDEILRVAKKTLESEKYEDLQKFYGNVKNICRPSLLTAFVDGKLVLFTAKAVGEKYTPKAGERIAFAFEGRFICFTPQKAVSVASVVKCLASRVKLQDALKGEKKGTFALVRSLFLQEFPPVKESNEVSEASEAK